MSEEISKNWKEGLIAEYARIENEIATETNEMVTDPDLIKLMKEQAKLNDMIALLKGTYSKNIEVAQQQQAGIKLELAEKCSAGTATLRTTKSLHIRSKEKLVAFLELNKKLTDFIKNFEITKLRKIKDAGMLEDEICTWDEKKSISISLTKEAEQ